MNPNNSYNVRRLHNTLMLKALWNSTKSPIMWEIYPPLTPQIKINIPKLLNYRKIPPSQHYTENVEYLSINHKQLRSTSQL